MNVQTGELVEVKELDLIPGFIPVNRKLTPVEITERKIKLKSLCACGSNKRFMYCCYLGKKKKRNKKS